MDLRDWNRFLWHVVQSRLHRSGRRIYLSFDDTLLSEELKNTGRSVTEESPTVALNAAIQRHCGMMANGCIGLRADEDKPLRRNNWHWVLLPNKSGRSLALVFAAQQILAAEGMRGASFYESYWKAFGATSYEVRRNPFGDIGRNSFAALWSRLRLELKEVLYVADSQITFEPGKGSNKYRNFPVSQSLLSEKDLRAASMVIRRPDMLDDAQLLAALKRVKLSKPGKAKVYTKAISEYLVSQFREFATSTVVETAGTREVGGDRVVPKVQLNDLSLYEEQELFGESTYHCYVRGSMEPARPLVDAALEHKRFIVFSDQEDEIRIAAGSRIPSSCSQVFVLGRKSDESWLAERLADASSSLAARSSFFPVSNSIGADYLLISCLSVPEGLKGLCLDTMESSTYKQSKQRSRGLAFRGGVCVNQVSKSFLIGFPPGEVLVDDVVLGMDYKCELDAEQTVVGNALSSLGMVRTPGRYKLQVGREVAYLELVGPREIERVPILERTEVCVLPPMLIEESGHGQDGAARFASTVNTIITEEWARKRESLLRQISGALVGGNVRWVKVGPTDAKKCLAMASYLSLPGKVLELISDRISSIGIAPWPLYAQSSLKGRRS
tara:strand:- start:1538 stop:3373 length:1836 start_codon:yes stop_codon:yes gene_type:complete